MAKSAAYSSPSQKQESPESSALSSEDTKRALLSSELNDLGWKYDHGDEGVQSNASKAMRLYALAASQGQAEAFYNLAATYQHGLGVEQNPVLALTLYKLASAKAMHLLSHQFYTGMGVKQNTQTSAQWCEKAANWGYGPAQNDMAVLLDSKQAISQSNKKPLDYWMEAAEQGSAQACYNLAVSYQLGIGTAPNPRLAYALYSMAKAYAQYHLNVPAAAAELGMADAQNSRANQFYHGNQEKQNFKTAHSWYQKAANQGHAVAQYNLAWMYEQGESVEQDMDKALQWYLQSAAQADHVAIYQLASFYEKGQGVEQDLKLATALYELASLYDPDPENQAAARWRELQPSLSPEDKKAAKTLVRLLSKPGNFLKAINPDDKNNAVNSELKQYLGKVCTTTVFS